MNIGLEHIAFGTLVRAGVTGLIGIPLVWLLANIVTRPLKGHASQHVRVLVRKLILYVGLLIIFVSILHELGFQLSALLGAAGIAGIAIGFAAQTSIANFISGIFLLIEHPFVIGDVIEYEDVIGKVESIDLLAVDVRTSDNKLVRIPNEALIKNKFKNRTYFTMRRIQFLVQTDNLHAHKVMAYIEDILGSNAAHFMTQPPFTVEVYQLHGPVVTIRVNVWIKVETADKAVQYFMNKLREFATKESFMIGVSFNDI